MIRVADGSRWDTDFFVVRTPYLPIEELFTLSERLSSASEVQMAGRLSAASLEADRQAVRERMRFLSGRADVREALLLGSPSLEAHLDDWLAHPDRRESRKFELSLYRYLARMAGRATPFGLFAGITVVRCNSTTPDRTVLRLKERAKYQRHSRLDSTFLCAIAEHLAAKPSVRARLTFFPNSSLYATATGYRYAQLRADGRSPRYELIAVESTGHLRAALDRATSGANHAQLTAAVLAIQPEATERVAGEFIDELIDTQILIPELMPAVTGAEPGADMLATLSDMASDEFGAGACTLLTAVYGLLNDLDVGGPGAAPTTYRSIASTAAAIGAPTDIGHLFRVNLMKPPEIAALSKDFVSDVAAAADLLHRINGSQSDGLDQFRQEFADRYGDREVPLCEALDAESGVGFHHDAVSTVIDEAWLAGLQPHPKGRQQPPVLSGRDDIMLRLVAEALLEGRQQIALGPSEIESLVQADDVGRKLPLPDSLCVVLTVLARDESAVRDGRYRILLSSVSGPSGMNLFGRHCHSSESLTRYVQSHLRAEAARRPDVIYAEIAHLPPFGAGNIVSRPRLSEYEIPYLGSTGSPVANQIPVSDLMISLSGDRLVLRSRSRDREVVPRSTTSHNSDGPGNLPVYRFLSAIQTQHVSARVNFTFGALANLPYLPRVTCGRLILSPAQWNLSYEQAKRLTTGDISDRFTTLQSIRDSLRLPRWVAFAQRDRQLPVDLDNIVAVDAALELVKHRGTMRLTELFLGDDDLFARSREGRFVHELALPLLRTSPAVAHPQPRSRTIGQGRRTFPPGSEWLYAKLYAGELGVDAILERVAAVAHNAITTGAADRWFFVRYADPDWHVRLRIHGDRRRLLDEPLPELFSLSESALSDKRLWRIQLDTYEREVERYGGYLGIELAEKLFWADSEAANDVVRMARRASGQPRWLFAVAGVDRLLGDFGMNTSARHAIVRAARNQLAGILTSDRAFEHEVGARYREVRQSVDSFLDQDGGIATRTGAVEIFARRSQLVKGTVRHLTVLSECRQLTRSLDSLARCYMHMHVNRVLRRPTREVEFIIYDFLARSYWSQLARTGGRTID